MIQKRVDELYKKKDQLTEDDWQQIAASVYDLPSVIHLSKVAQLEAVANLRSDELDKGQEQTDGLLSLGTNEEQDNTFIAFCKEQLDAYKILLAYRTAEIRRDSIEALQEMEPSVSMGVAI